MRTGTTGPDFREAFIRQFPRRTWTPAEACTEIGQGAEHAAGHGRGWWRLALRWLVSGATRQAR